MKNCLKTQLPCPAGSRRKEDGRVLPGGVGSVLTWHGKEPATSLLMSSLFRDNLVSVLCWRLWPGSEQPGEGHLLCCWSVWGGEVHHENSCQESREGDTPSPLSSWPSSYLPLKWHEGHSPVGRAQHSSLGPREQRRLSLLHQLGSNHSAATFPAL